MKLTVGSLFLVLGLLVHVPAQAQGTVLVLGLGVRDGDERHASQAETLTRALRTEIGSTAGWSVHRETIGLREAATAHGCTWYDPSEDCVAEMGRSYGVQYVLHGRIRPEGLPNEHNYTVSLELIAARDGSRFGDTYRTVVIDGDMPVLTLRVRELVADINITPRLAVDADATSVAEEPRDASSDTHAPRAGGDAGRDLYTGLSIGSYALAAVALAVAIGSWARLGDIQSDATFHAYRERWPTTTADVCAEANSDPMAGNIRGTCSDASLFEGLQYISLAAAAFAALGTTFLVLNAAEGPAQPRVTLVPAVGPGLAALSLAVEF